MKKILLLIATVCMILPSGVSAQENGNKDKNGKTVYGPYLTNKADANWFIGAGAGVGMYLGGFNNGFGARIRPSFNFNFGKWVTPEIGIRATFNFTPLYRESIHGSWLKFQHYYFHGDFLWNISNSIGGYKETRFFEAVPFVGAGFGFNRGGNLGSKSCEFLLNAGVINKFRISNRVTIDLEFIASAAPQDFDKVAQCSSQTIDVPMNAIAGVTVKLGKTGFKRAVKTAQPAAVVNVSDNSADKEYDKFKKELDGVKADVEKLTAENEALKAKLAVVPAPVAVAKPTPKLTLYFGLGKTTLGSTELEKLDEYMNSASSEINSGKSIDIIGEADKATGNATINQKLSTLRAEYVKNLLISKYKVDPKSISAVGIGETDNKSSIPEHNRIVTITLK